MRYQSRVHVRNSKQDDSPAVAQPRQTPDGTRRRKVNTAWMAGFKLKGGPPLGRILAREYHQPAGEIRGW